MGPVRVFLFLVAMVGFSAIALGEEIQGVGRGIGPGGEREGDVGVFVEGPDRSVTLFGVLMLEPDHPLSVEARRYIGESVIGRALRVEIPAGGGDSGIVYLADWACLNGELIRRGLARWDYREDAEGRFAQAETEAKLARRGIWAGAPVGAPRGLSGLASAPSVEALASMIMSLSEADQQRLMGLLVAAERDERPGSTQRAREPAPAAKTHRNAPEPRDDPVVITATGEKFHRPGCRHAKKSGRRVDRREAMARGYTACSVCGP